MATTFEVIFIGNLARIDTTQGNETVENAAGILGTYGSSTAPLSTQVRTLSANDTSEDDDDTYDLDNGGGYDSFRINGGAPQNFDASAIYNATITYVDGTTANITAVVFQDDQGNTYLAPEETANADQTALVAKPILSLSLNSVSSNTGDMVASRVAGDFISPVDGTAGADTINASYTDAQGDRITAGNDYVLAGAGNDTVSAGDGQDSVFGGDGNDLLLGEAGNDTLSGDAGDDTLVGGAGADSLSGGAGRDTANYSGSTQGVNVNLLSGTGTGGDAQGDTLTGVDNLVGSSFDDTLAAHNTQGDIYGGGGNDQIYGGTGSGDRLYGGDGSDRIYGSDGADWLYGDAGTDLLYGGTGADTLYGGADGDTLQGDAGADLLYADGGNDTLAGGADSDSVFGGAGEDMAQLGDGNDTFGNWGTDAGNDTVRGEGGNDSIIGDTGNDLLYGGDGDDYLTGGAGSDTIFGGTGSDHAGITDDHDADTYDMGEDAGNTDWDQAWFNNWSTTNGVSVTFTGTDAGTYTYPGGAAWGSFTGVEGVGGTGYNDTINASADTDGQWLWGMGGDDSVAGGSGNDLVFGGTGNDSLSGNAGADSLFGEDGRDTLTGGQGSDTIFGGNDNDRIEGGSEADSLFGDAGADVLYGDAGNDTLSGGTEADTLYGGADSDRLYGDEGNDLLFGEAGLDTLSGGIGDDTLYGGVEADSLSGDDGNDRLYGEDGLDTLVGGAGNDTLFGGGDADSLSGGTGDDLLYADAGIDTVSAGAGNDTVYGGGDADSILGEDGNDRLYGEVGMDTLEGGLGDDQLFGGYDDDSLSGEAGNDLLDGGAKSDRLYGGDGNDTIDAGTEDDTVYGGAGADLVSGGEGQDYLIFGEGDDTVYGGGGGDFIDDEEWTQLSGRNLVYGGDGSDQIFTGYDNDTVYGDAGDDTIAGESGDDVLYGGAGADEVYGGDDRDTILILDGQYAVGDFVAGGEGGDDFDVLDLSGYGWARTDIVYSGAESGTVTFYDTNGAVLGTMDFIEIEQVIPCFTKGTLVDTPDGPRPVESLQPGDLVLTRDDGPQPLRWVGQRRLGLADLMADPSLQPVEIAADALAPGLPERAVKVSPQHRIMFGGAACELYFGTEEVLIPATQLLGQPGIAQRLQPVTYVHLMFDRHQIVRTHGMWSESFQPGERVLDGMPDPQRDELMRLFPDLEVPGSYPAARMTLKGYETRVLLRA